MLEPEREMVAAAARRLAGAGWVTGTAGNASLRCGERIVITATGTDLAQITAEDVVVVDLDGHPVAEGGAQDSEREPSSELAIHVGAYRRLSAGAIVHTHSPAATAVSTVRTELPAIHYGMAELGGAIPVAPYATPGSARLAELVLEALAGRRAVLMANHGALTLGDDLAAAVEATRQLEWFAELYLRAAAIGHPAELSEAELDAWRRRTMPVEVLHR